MKKLSKIAVVAFVASLLFLAFSACNDDKQYPIEPVIEFKDFVNYSGDSGEIRLNFTDGDGDIGLGQGDTNTPYNKEGDYYHNIFMRYMYYDTSGTLIPFFYLPTDTDSVDALSFNYRIPVITPVGQDKSLNGEIHVRVFPPFPHNRMRLKIYIVDRALHKSNEIETPDLYPN